ncbi:MAG: dTMP kinase [Spirochaetaceae bacterium]|nr:MAG: dTMP kinase [Spirochaetaceae bacterium]
MNAAETAGLLHGVIYSRSSVNTIVSQREAEKKHAAASGKHAMRKVLERFVVFEGLDGAGTTTQARLLQQTMQHAGQSVWATAEPSEGAVGRLIRAALRREQVLEADTLAYLFAADRNEHLFAREHGICERLRTSWVICDRYLFSSLAYQAVETDPGFVATLNAAFPLPAWLIYVDVDPLTCATRRAERNQQELFDSLDFQRRVHTRYNAILADFAAEQRMRIVRIDGNQPADTIAAEVCSALGFQPI